jgi:hypothetical protein
LLSTPDAASLPVPVAMRVSVCSAGASAGLVEMSRLPMRILP